ncbi:MAG: flagellar type III secretion system pore protein FliP [Proteobacteria bacterium]|nr:flagellar type III secretion system pore protein FliP [Pseudomonadota bacterium]
MNKKVLTLFLLFAALMVSGTALGAEPLTLPSVDLSIGGSEGPEGVTKAIQIVLLLTLMTLAPAFILMMTSFTRLIIVFSILRQAMGVQQSPPNQVLIGLTLFMTFFIMSPALIKINETAVKPYMSGELTQATAFTKALDPLKGFMIKNTRKKDITLFQELANSDVTEEEIANIEQDKNLVSMLALVPAFITSELKTAFQIGFLIYLPFLVIDMVVASVLMSMGMMMLPPVMISLPFKLMLFVLADGWYLLVGSLVQSFH